MKTFKNTLFKMIGVLSLFLAAIVIIPTSLGSTYQPKCPEEFLR